MELKQAIENRVSVRSFMSDRVPLTDLREMVRLASLAPSVNNYQPWKFIALTGRQTLQKMAEIVSEKIALLPRNTSQASGNITSQVEWFSTFFREAPAVIALVMEEYETVLEKGVNLTHEEINRNRNFPDLQSAGACIQNLLLSATDMGYGACWLSAPLIAKSELEAMLDINKPYKLIAFIAVGKPRHMPQPKQRKAIDEIFELRE